MDPGRSRSKPWKSWSDFTGWAQDFSLNQKVLGGFLGVAVLVGLATSFIGTRLARETILDRARIRLSSDLATAGFIFRTAQENLELKLRLTAGSEKIKEAIEKGDLRDIRNRLAVISLENDLDFLSVTDDQGRVLVRAFIPDEKQGGNVFSDFIVAEALKGKNASGVRLISAERLGDENPTLMMRLGKDADKTGMVLEAAHPLMVETRVVGTLYAGILLNNNNFIVERISERLFKGEVYGEREIGYVTIYQGDVSISTTLKGKDGLPRVGTKAGAKIREEVLEKNRSEISRDKQLGTEYLSAAEPIRNNEGKVIGALQVATQQEPITLVVDRLVATFLVIGLLGVILMGAITYFLVKWINRPLEQMLNSAKRAAEGDLSHEVPVIAHDEVGELAATFNLMIRNLAESRSKLEERGKQLASKVEAQTGELDQAREQVARVSKLASLEKMADGMAHIMAHISDPLVSFAGMEEDSGTTSKILVLDSDEKVLGVCERILESEGLDVKTTESVQEALKELEREFYDVIVADIDMPEMGGVELLKEIKFRQPEILVIMTAPFKSTEEAVETVKMGAYDYIPKPFGPHQILLMVYTALQSREVVAKTRRQHAEQRAETIFQRLPVAIALADEAHRVVYNNRAFIELAGGDGQEVVQGKTFRELFGVDPLESDEETGGSKWLKLENVGRTAKLYNFKLPEENLRVLMLVDITETVIKDQQADVFKTETITKAQQVIHQQMRVAQEIAGLLGETTAETKAVLFELIKLAGNLGASR
ncbi:MAG: response regulator [Desulfomonile sp.]|jgi:DNA-binding response OmpR family regulator/HAMP domain-containing protein